MPYLSHRMWTWRDGLVGEGACSQAWPPELSPGIHMSKERTNSCEFYSDLYMHSMACTCRQTHTHTNTHIYTHMHTLNVIIFKEVYEQLLKGDFMSQMGPAGNLPLNFGHT